MAKRNQRLRCTGQEHAEVRANTSPGPARARCGTAENLWEKNNYRVLSHARNRQATPHFLSDNCRTNRSNEDKDSGPPARVLQKSLPNSSPGNCSGKDPQTRELSCPYGVTVR